MKKKITLLLALIIIAHLFTMCGSGDELKKNRDYKTQKSNQITIINNKTFDSLNISQTAKAWGESLYSKFDNQSIWIKNDSIPSSVSNFFNYLNSDVALNIPLGYLSNMPYAESEALINKEIKSILRCAEFLSLKDTTIINYSNNMLNNAKLISPEDFIQFIKNKKDTVSWIEHLIHYKENNQQMIQLHQTLNQFVFTYGIENNKDNNIYLKIPEDSLADVFIHQQLLNRNFISDSISNKDTLIMKLRSFQLMNGLNPDGKLGKNTLDALLETNYSRYLKGIISLDKMRMFPDSLLNKKLIVVNIPSYLLHLYVDNEIINTSKVIIGTKRNQTPIFTSIMKYIVVNPYWNVPYSISSREILPHLKKDSSYLKRNRYSILDKDKNPIMTDSIDWNKYGAHNFPFFIRQKPGSKNSLGLVKLMFPNEKSIYIHDTPSKYLFARDQRTFSHGCIRTESPFQLVDDILNSENHLYLDSIDVLKQRSKETYLMLTETFPVSIVYHTAGINDSTQQVQFYKDIYKKEVDLYKLLQKPVQPQER